MEEEQQAVIDTVEKNSCVIRDQQMENGFGDRHENIQRPVMMPINHDNCINQRLEVCCECSHGQGFVWCSGTVVKVSDGTNIVINGKVTKLCKANEAVLVKWDATE